MQHFCCSAALMGHQGKSVLTQLPYLFFGRRPVVESEMGKGGSMAEQLLTLGLVKGKPRASTAAECWSCWSAGE